MTAINFTAEFIRPEASAFAHSCEICPVSIALCDLAL